MENDPNIVVGLDAFEQAILKQQNNPLGLAFSLRLPFPSRLCGTDVPVYVLFQQQLLYLALRRELQRAVACPQFSGTMRRAIDGMNPASQQGPLHSVGAVQNYFAVTRFELPIALRDLHRSGQENFPLAAVETQTAGSDVR